MLARFKNLFAVSILALLFLQQQLAYGESQAPSSSAAQPIIQLWRVRLAVKQSELAHSIVQEKARALCQQTANQTRRAYYKALELQGGLAVVEATRLLYAEVDRITDERLKEKAVLPVESLEVKQQLANSATVNGSTTVG